MKDGMMNIQLLRGRVFVRPTGDNSGVHEGLKRIGLVMPANYEMERTQKGQCLRGIVVAMGPPAFDKRGNEVDPGFKVGDEIFHLGQHKSREVEWNGEKLRACTQEEVLCVIMPSWSSVAVKVEGEEFHSASQLFGNEEAE
jgi:co-chaperonin GroES (HSP10)